MTLKKKRGGPKKKKFFLFENKKKKNENPKSEILYKKKHLFLGTLLVRDFSCFLGRKIAKITQLKLLIFSGDIDRFFCKGLC